MRAQSVAIDVGKLLSGWATQQNGELEPFAATLGLSQTSLESLGCVYAPEHRAFAFPMRDAQQRTIGIRLRNDHGDKWAVKGSRAGMFLPKLDLQSQLLLIVEGPTDAAAAVELGFDVIGRSACLGQEQMIRDYVRRRSPHRVFIIADNDAPGQRGARRLRDDYLRRASIVTLPSKDLREFKNCGGTREILNELLRACVG